MLLATLIACGEAVEEGDETEFAHMLSDMMASIDEASGESDGEFGALMRTPRRQSMLSFLPKLQALFEREPLATNCSAVEFSACSTGASPYVRQRELEDCQNGGFTYTGDVTLKFNTIGCALNIGSIVNRRPNILVEGRRGSNLTISGPEGVETITRTASDTLTYANTGITREFYTELDGTILEFIGSTTTDIAIDSRDRTEREVTAGVIEITNETSEETCTFTPGTSSKAVTWQASCRCPVLGQWNGQCSGTSKGSGTATVKFNGCGAVDFTYRGETTSMNVDRCF